MFTGGSRSSSDKLAGDSLQLQGKRKRETLKTRLTNKQTKTTANTCVPGTNHCWYCSGFTAGILYKAVKGILYSHLMLQNLIVAVWALKLMACVGTTSPKMKIPFWQFSFTTVTMRAEPQKGSYCKIHNYIFVIMWMRLTSWSPSSEHWFSLSQSLFRALI